MSGIFDRQALVDRNTQKIASLNQNGDREAILKIIKEEEKLGVYGPKEVDRGGRPPDEENIPGITKRGSPLNPPSN